MTGSAKQSTARATVTMDCFVASLLAMTVFDPAIVEPSSSAKADDPVFQSSSRQPYVPNAKPRRRDERNCAHAGVPAFAGTTERRLRPGRRLLAVALREREDFDAGRGDADRMLELRRQRTVARHRGPAVGQDFYMRLAEIDHRLDGEEHAGLQRHAFAGPADMNDVGLVMKHAAQAVPAEIAHHAHALRLDKTLDGVADVAGGGAGLYRGDAAHHRLIGHFNQPFGLAGN